MRPMKLLAIYFHAIEQGMVFLMPPQQPIMVPEAWGETM